MRHNDANNMIPLPPAGCVISRFPKKWWFSKGEDTLWNISFRLFHETKFNTYFITCNLITWILYKICKKKSSTNHHKKKYPIPTFATCPCCGHWLTCFSLKGYSYRRLFFHYFTRDKNGFIHCRIQLILSNK